MKGIKVSRRLLEDRGDLKVKAKGHSKIAMNDCAPRSKFKVIIGWIIKNGKCEK